MNQLKANGRKSVKTMRSGIWRGDGLVPRAPSSMRPRTVRRRDGSLISVLDLLDNHAACRVAFEKLNSDLRRLAGDE
jgi:hypothetical protein